jgi:predicted nucleic acid-binding protein
VAGLGRRATSQVPRKPIRTFIDTNILLYCDDQAAPKKQCLALQLVIENLSDSSGVVSLQVLQEYFVIATRKFKLDAAVARQKVLAYTRFDVVEPSIADVLAAIDLHRLNHFSYWDAMILRSAKKSGCKVVLTEDMQHGQVIDGVRIVNPFL